MARTHLALLRGVNVGGGNKLPMADLRRIASDLGWQSVGTHVNSGNLVFSAQADCAELERALASAIEEFMGKPIATFVVTAAEWTKALETCPYGPEDPKFVHLQLHREPLSQAVQESIKTLLDEADDGTEATVAGRWLYLHTPRGLSQSVAFTKLPRLLPKDDQGTARNLNSASKIAALLAE